MPILYEAVDACLARRARQRLAVQALAAFENYLTFDVLHSGLGSLCDDPTRGSAHLGGSYGGSPRSRREPEVCLPRRRSSTNRVLLQWVGLGAGAVFRHGVAVLLRHRGRGSVTDFIGHRRKGCIASTDLPARPVFGPFDLVIRSEHRRHRFTPPKSWPASAETASISPVAFLPDLSSAPTF